MKQVCWHSRRSKAYRGLPEARGQSETHGDSNLYTMEVRPCVTAKLPVLGALVLEPHFAQSCGRFLLLTWGKVLAAAGSESFMVEKSIAGSGARAEPLQAAAQSVATGISTESRQARMCVFPRPATPKLCSRHSAVGLVGLFVCTIILEIQFFA